MTNKQPTTYRMGSSALIHTPGIVRWAINGYSFPRDRNVMLKVIREGYGIPTPAARALLSQAVPYTVEGDTVTFTA